MTGIHRITTIIPELKPYAAFTFNIFDDQERNLTIVKTNFKVLKLKFYTYNFEKAFYPLHKLHIA